MNKEVNGEVSSNKKTVSLLEKILKSRVEKVKKKYAKKQDRDPFELKKLVDKHITRPLIRDKILDETQKALQVCRSLQQLERKCLGTNYKIAPSFLIEYCQNIKKKCIIPSFKEVDGVWEEFKQISVSDHQILEEAASLVYQIQKRINGVFNASRLALLGDLKNYTRERGPEQPRELIKEDINWCRKNIDRHELLSVYDLTPKQSDKERFLNNISQERYFQDNIASSFQELIHFLDDIDETQFLGESIKKEIIRKHIFLAKEEQGDDLQALKDKHSIFSLILDDKTGEYKDLVQKLQRLEKGIWGRENIEELKTPSEAYDYCCRTFGGRWYINLPEWGKKKEVSPGVIIELFYYTKFLKVKTEGIGGLEGAKERTERNNVFEEAVAKLIHRKKTELAEMATFDLYLMLENLRSAECPSVKANLESLFLGLVNKRDLERYHQDFAKKVVFPQNLNVLID